MKPVWSGWGQPSTLKLQQVTTDHSHGGEVWGAVSIWPGIVGHNETGWDKWGISQQEEAAVEQGGAQGEAGQVCGMAREGGGDQHSKQSKVWKGVWQHFCTFCDLLDLFLVGQSKVCTFSSFGRNRNI